jgi:hypothetical protein
MRNQFTSTPSRPLRRIPALCLLPLLAVLLGSCAHPAPIPDPDNPYLGAYTLVSVGGNKLPYLTTHEGTTMTIKSGVFAINADGSCSSTIIFAVPPNADTTRVVKANYTRQGAKLTMKWERAGTTIGTAEADAFTMNNEGMIFAYRK